MPNQLSPYKEKIIYAEWSDIRDELAVIRQELSSKEGREITEAEFIRKLTLDYVNKRRIAQGKKKLNLDPTSSPGGVLSTSKRRKS